MRTYVRQRTREPARSVHFFVATPLGVLLPCVAGAHSFSAPYVPPLPLAMYAYGCAAAVLLSFVVVGYVVRAPVAVAGAMPERIRRERAMRTVNLPALYLLRAGVLGSLVLTIIAGWIGTADAAHNIAMILFWVAFLLGFAYLSLLVGDLYSLINPWKTIVYVFERLGLDFSTPRAVYPRRLAYWPAFLLYAALLWMELFTAPNPKVLSVALLSYTGLTLAGAALFGKRDWFERADVFGVYFSLFGKLAPVEYQEDSAGRWHFRFRAPLAEILRERPAHLSVLLFVLLLLSSTTYDAIHETTLWIGLYWRNLLNLLQPLWNDDLGKAQQALMGGYLAYRQAGLIIFPFLYLAAYGFIMWCTRVLTGSRQTAGSLALAFCYSLLPIAVAYHFAHYFAFLLAEAGSFPWRLSDPFGFGWNLLSLSRMTPPPFTLTDAIWHTQVAALLVGHVLSVYLAHETARRVEPGPHVHRKVLIGQLPLLLLMVVYTIFGLWVLSLPLGST